MKDVINSLNELLNGKLPKSIQKFNATKEILLKQFVTKKPHVKNYFRDVEKAKVLKQKESYISDL